MLHAHVHGAVHCGMELRVECLYLVVPGELALGYIVKFLLYSRREVVVEDIREKLCEECVHHLSYICGYELATL